MSKMTDRELISNLRQGRAVRAKTMKLLQGLSQDSIDRRPSQSGLLVGEKGTWSLGEHADHILRVEAYIRREVIEKLIEMSRTAPRPVLRLTVSEVNLIPAFIPQFLLKPSEVLLDLNNRLSAMFLPRRLTEQFIRYSVFPVRTPGHGRRHVAGTSMNCSMTCRNRWIRWRNCSRQVPPPIIRA